MGVRASGYLSLVAVALLVSAAAFSCIAPDKVFWLGFSPTGRYLAYATQHGELYVIDLKDKFVRQIEQEIAVDRLQWSPTEDLLVFCAKRDGQWDLALLDPPGSVTFLTRDRWRDFGPTWAPDGRSIYYVSSRGGGCMGDYDIQCYDLQTGQFYPLICGPHDQVEPLVSPDGRWLAAISYQTGNPLLIVYALKALRVVRVALPPNLRGGCLRLLTWLGQSRRLLCQVELNSRYYMVECDVEKEKTTIVDSSADPFESVVFDPRRNEVFYATGGQVYRLRVDDRVGAKRRLKFDGLPVTRLAADGRGGRLALVVAGKLIASASLSGREVEPLVPGQLIYWGDFELRRKNKRNALRYYDMFIEQVVRAEAPDDPAAEARFKLSRAPLLCWLGYRREALAYLEEASEVLEAADELTSPLRNRIYALSATVEFVWNGRVATARRWLEKIAPQRRADAEESAEALLLEVLNHPDRNVARSCRRAIAAFWMGETERAVEILQRLLRSHPADPVVQRLYVRAQADRFLALVEPIEDDVFGFFEPSAPEDQNERALAGMLVSYPEILGDRFVMDREWFEKLAVALVSLGDSRGLKRLLMKHGSRFVRSSELIDAYRGYWRPAPARWTDEVVARVMFDPDILDLFRQTLKQPHERTAVDLACARWALIAGDYDRMEAVLSNVAERIEKFGGDRTFGPDGEGRIAYAVLEAELAERRDEWDKAVARYRDAARMAQRLAAKMEEDKRAVLRRLHDECRFRAALLQRGAAARGELSELLTVERGVGDRLMLRSTDPTSLANGIHNFFALLNRVATPWVKDLVYLKAGQCYGELGRWGEAAFCLRVAAASQQRFVAAKARAELADLYRKLGDSALVAYYSRRR